MTKQLLLINTKNCFMGSRDQTNHARTYNELFTYFKFDGMKSDQIK